jgi:hypothetical protein
MKGDKVGLVEWHNVRQSGACGAALQSWFRCQLGNSDSSLLTHFLVRSVLTFIERQTLPNSNDTSERQRSANVKQFGRKKSWPI